MWGEVHLLKKITFADHNTKTVNQQENAHLE